MWLSCKYWCVQLPDIVCLLYGADAPETVYVCLIGGEVVNAKPLEALSVPEMMLYLESLERSVARVECYAHRSTLGFRTLGAWKGDSSRGHVKRRKAFNSNGSMRRSPL